MLALTIERIVCSSLRVGPRTASHQVTGMQDMSKILRSYSIGILILSNCWFIIETNNMEC